MQVWNDKRGVSICANLSSTEGSIVTPRGLLSGSWTCGGVSPGYLPLLAICRPVLTDCL